jgi:WD40 repeat protein
VLKCFLKFSFGNQVWRDGHEYYVRSIEQAHKGVIASVVFHGGWLYSGSWDSSIKAWPIEEVLSADAFSHVQRACGATVTALACTHEKLYAGVAHTIQGGRRLGCKENTSSC